MKIYSSISVPQFLTRILAALLAGAVFALAAPAFAQNEPATPTTDQAVAATTQSVAATGQTTQAIQDTGQVALSKVQTLWQRIDERRLKNRTADQIVAWVIMGLLVGGLFYRLGEHSQINSVVLGLVGAFIGGILANVIQLDLGLGPVLITYEDLLFTVVGGVLILAIGRRSDIAKLFKRPQSQ